MFKDFPSTDEGDGLSLVSSGGVWIIPKSVAAFSSLRVSARQICSGVRSGTGKSMSVDAPPTFYQLLSLKLWLFAFIMNDVQYNSPRYSILRQLGCCFSKTGPRVVQLDTQGVG